MKIHQEQETCSSVFGGCELVAACTADDAVELDAAAGDVAGTVEVVSKCTVALLSEMPATATVCVSASGEMM